MLIAGHQHLLSVNCCAVGVGWRPEGGCQGNPGSSGGARHHCRSPGEADGGAGRASCND